jgi:large subunit ribosomal protein L6
MSRIGKKPIVIPEKVKAKIEGKVVLIEGPLGKLSYDLPQGISAEIKDGKICLFMDSNLFGKSALYGTARARINNMVTGVLNGFSKVLEINGVGFKGMVEGRKLSLQLGFSHPFVIDVPEGIKMSFDPKQVLLTISGIDKEKVGNIASQIKRVRPPEPYQGTGIKYQGEHIIRKPGKTAAGVTGVGVTTGTGAKK